MLATTGNSCPEDTWFNYPAGGNAGSPLLFALGRNWLGVPEAERELHTGIQLAYQNLSPNWRH